MRRSVRSMPSSLRNDVTRTGVYAGPTAVKTLRLPASYAVQAMRSAADADTSSTGMPGFRYCASVGRLVGAADGATEARGIKAATRAATGTATRRTRNMGGLTGGRDESQKIARRGEKEKLVSGRLCCATVCYMDSVTSVGVRELRQNLSVYLAR